MRHYASIIIVVLNETGFISRNPRSIDIRGSSISSLRLLTVVRSSAFANKVFASPFGFAQWALPRSLHPEEILRAYVVKSAGTIPLWTSLALLTIS